MLAAITQSVGTAQIFAVIAAIIFAVLAVWRLVKADVVTGFLCVGLAFTAAALIFLA